MRKLFLVAVLAATALIPSGASAAPKPQLVAPAYDSGFIGEDCYEGVFPGLGSLSDCSVEASFDFATGRGVFSANAGPGWSTDAYSFARRAFTPKFARPTLRMILRLNVAYARVEGGTSWVSARIDPSFACSNCTWRPYTGYLRLVGTDEGEPHEISNVTVDVPITISTNDGSDIPLAEGRVDVSLDAIALAGVGESALAEADMTATVLLQA